jgi:FHS family L-fucose permease-like MFS transporter
LEKLFNSIVAYAPAIKMGDPTARLYRLTLAGGINSFGTTIWCYLARYCTFGMGNDKKTSTILEDIKTPAS